VRNRLCQTRNAQTARRPFSRNRDACEKHLSLCAIGTFPRPFPKHDFSSVEAFGLRGPDRLHVSTRGFSTSFGGGLAQIWAEASDPERRAWSSTGEFVFDWMRPCRPRAINALPLPARGFRGGRGRGEWGKLGAAERVTSLD
jgi:hypothetical protein